VSIFDLIRGSNVRARKTSQVQNNLDQSLKQTFRAFNLGRLENTEVSIWLEVATSPTSNQLVVRIKNEGTRPISNLELSVKTSSQIVIVNRGAVFGTSKNKEIIKSLPARKTLIYTTELKLHKNINSADISVAISKKITGGNFENLCTRLTLPPKIAQTSA
jgi:hypothetical protein